MPIALLANTAASGASANTATTSAIDTRGASIILVSVSSYTVPGIPPITDNLGNTWTQIRSDTGGGYSRTTLYACYNPTTGASHTFTTSLSASYPAIFAAAFSGTTTTPLDQQNGANSAGSTSLAAGSVTPTTNNQLVVTGLTLANASGISINSSFSILNSRPFIPAFAVSGAFAFKIHSMSAINPTWSWVTSSQAAANIATFTALPGGLIRPNDLTGVHGKFNPSLM